METLPKKLQIWVYCFYGSQQLSTFYEYKKLKLLVSLVDLKAFQISFLNKLLLKQSKQSCWYSVIIFLAEYWEKNYPVNQKHENLVLAIIFSSQSFWFYSRKSLLFLSSSHLWDNSLTPNITILEYSSRQASLRRPLYY